MNLSSVDEELLHVLSSNLDADAFDWLNSKIDVIIENKSAKDLYLTYSLLSTKANENKKISFELDDKELESYLLQQQANELEISRIYLLIKVLKTDATFFQPKVANLIQVADTGELITFLKFVILLPNAEEYNHVAVEALRTNIATVFEAISMGNPYPARFFNDQQWNQMYLKAAFVQLDLSQILEVDARANKDLARIISDYAHERWAASREIDPLFWRPVSSFIDGTLYQDMKRLLESDNPSENRAGALCCHFSDNREAQKLLQNYQQLNHQVTNGTITWENVK
ncbi:EboA domain-containing protein [Euzebyella saccharophila]|uniref:EboA domain-containing protein n=1 Tax=Euzebyella saccharophila TaxID=679664 RepID=A0ABV8JJZ6_9FLAO|nr:EboA domain-containing protein [Euzebyella saccharophila]MDO1499454.1 EboA domain-containing protein [Winogradskyella maritima]